MNKLKSKLIQSLLLFAFGFVSLLIIEKVDLAISLGAFLIIFVSGSLGGYYQAKIEEKLR